MPTVNVEKLSEADQRAYKHVYGVVYKAIRGCIGALTPAEARELATESYLPENQGVPA